MPRKVLVFVVLLLTFPVLAQSVPVNVVQNPTATQPIVQPGNTIFSPNNVSGIVYVVTSYNWAPQSPAMNLTAGTPATITLNPCPAGLLVPASGVASPFTRIWINDNTMSLSEAVILNNSGSTACPLQGGGSGSITFTPANGLSTGFDISPPMGRIIFEGAGLNNPQDLITFYDSKNGVNLFSTPGLRPKAQANDCAISGDGNGGSSYGLALRCATTISNYIGQLPDGSSWLERLTSAAKTFGNTIQIVSTLPTSSGLAPLSVQSQVPVSTLKVSNHPTLQYCAGTGTVNCPGTAVHSGQIIFGTVTLSGGAATLQNLSPPFTSNANCVANDTSDVTKGVKAIPQSNGTILFTGNGSDVISYQCVGS